MDNNNDIQEKWRRYINNNFQNENRERKILSTARIEEKSNQSFNIYINENLDFLSKIYINNEEIQNNIKKKISDNLNHNIDINFWGCSYYNYVENLTLQQALEKVKSVLQNEGKSENGKRPTIINETSMNLLIRYKPKKKEELANITGIGKKFIDNYGIFFIEVIKYYDNPININNSKLSEDEIEILNKLENRLINVNRRNKLLYNGKLNKDFSFDLYRLKEEINSENSRESVTTDITKEIENILLNQSDKVIKLINIFENANSKERIINNIKKIIRNAKKNEIETGNKELYIAYPFVQGKATGYDFDFKAPLVLFPIEIVNDGKSIYIENDKARDILYNTTLILANNKLNGENKVLPDNVIENLKKENFYKNLKTFYLDNNINLKDESNEIEKYYENNVDDFPKYLNGEFEIKKYMVIGLYSVYITSMYQDFHTIVENKEITDLIKALLWGFENEGDADERINPASVEEKEIETEKNIERNISYINDLDYSQEKALYEVKNNKGIVIQGPPGTGKSQTITSIIAQAVLENKKVLMVSEKKTALDVIYSRLGEISDYALLVDDIENKELFYEKINQIINKISKVEHYEDVSDYRLKIQANIKNVNSNLENLRNIYSTIYEKNDFGISVYNLYKKCKKINFLENSEKNERDKYNFLFEISEFNQKIMLNKYERIQNLYDLFSNKSRQKDYENYALIKKDKKHLYLIRENLSVEELYEFKKILSNYEQNEQEIEKSTNWIKNKFKLKPISGKYLNEIGEKFYKDYESFSKFRKNYFDVLKDIKLFLDEYDNNIAIKTIGDSLDEIEQIYLKYLIAFGEKFNLNFDDANEFIYNYILYRKIEDFENKNIMVIRNINDFDIIRDEIEKNITEKRKLTKKLVCNNLLAKSCNLNRNKQLNKLREICDKKRKLSVRKFMSKFKFEIMDSIQIFLMTPEAVSDMFELKNGIFDYVIFDEASQLYLEKSIPAIYRAKKVIVAGDKQQLKPSSLGIGRIVDEIEEDDLDSSVLRYESLLDAAEFKYQRTMLNYHYRSAKEELIAFSNHAFYNGKLLVVSNAKVDNEPAIQRIFVNDAQYIDKHNLKEANAVVDKLKEILKNRKNEETIGIITFNSSQRDLIEDCIEKEQEQDSTFSVAIENEKKRVKDGENIGLFVKNIENVQGDERDIIIFCIGYGKNQEGKISINFGWLNHDGGENRLNVAISRAKNKIYVITSIEPEELVVDGTKNRGPKLFKEYLRYVKAISNRDNELAESILLSLHDKKENDEGFNTFDSPFEEEVYNSLISRGYKVVTQYGVGGYKIDMVVKSKDGKENVLGIECDGRLYHSSKFARERDYHRQKYLESRGWKIYRIWSPNWWKNSHLEIEKLIKRIESI